MAYQAKAYTLREESTESGTRYFISFKDGQGKSHELEVSEQFFMEFRQMERRNRNLLQWDERHREFNEVWDETLYRRALRVPKSLDERMVEEERNETLYKAVGSLPEIQRRRFLLYYEYEFNFYQIAAMEHCTASAIQKSVAIAKEKVKAEIEEISPTVTDTARKRNLFFICVGLAALHTLTFFRGSKSIFKEVNAYVQRKQKHRPKGGKPCRSYRQSTPKRSFMNRLRNHPLWWTALSRQAYRCSAAHRR